MIDTKELRRLAQAANAEPDGDVLSWIEGMQRLQGALLPDDVIEILDRLEAAEKELAELRSSMKFRTSLIGRTEAERDALRAKITEMEKQEPFDADSDVFRSAFEAALKAGNWPATRQGGGYRSPSTQIAWRIAFSTVNRLKLYLAPGAQPAPIIPEAVVEVIAGLVYEVERNICPHEETHRGGQWEICDMCGARWADDRGGKPEFKWPEVVEKARAMLAAAPEAKP